MYKYFEELISEMHLALIIFVITYILLLSFSKYRAYIALGSAIVFVILGFLPLSDILKTLDWNVLMMIAERWESLHSLLNRKCPHCLRI